MRVPKSCLDFPFFNMSLEGKKWTPDEEQTLLERVKEGKKIAEIAEEFGRTSGAIRSRLNRLEASTSSILIEIRDILLRIESKL